MNEKHLPTMAQLDSKDPPPSYDELDIAGAFSKLNLDDRVVGSLPSADQCIAHLKLLECLALLRDDVGTNDGIYGIHNSFIPSAARQDDQAKVMARIREKRFALYVTRAAHRFETWFKSIEPHARMATSELMESPEYESIASKDFPLDFTIDNLPPLDVLMVWHSATLNPRTWFADCLRMGKLRLWQSGIPWAAVNAAISVDCSYRPTDSAKKVFEAQTGLPWDNLDEPPTHALKCPRCKELQQIPWTSVNQPESWFNVEAPGEQDTGFAGADFLWSCECSLSIKHDTLRVQKFRRDLQSLLIHHVPMPGTLLSLHGLTPQVSPSTYYSEKVGNSANRAIFPNRLMLVGVAADLVSKTDATSPDLTRVYSSVDDIRDGIEMALVDRDILKKAAAASNRRGYFVAKEERIAIRKMMSCYWENSSIFSMDLASAVIRQAAFVEKMHEIDWLNSPAVTNTMNRLIDKYDRYMHIIKSYPTEIAVPTLDVDLAWHTHQTTSPSYLAYSVGKTDKFIDHDDKIEENKLSVAFEWTSKTYESLFDAVYSECTCWYCEAIREAHTSTLERLLKPASKKKSAAGAAQDLDRLHSAESASGGSGGDSDRLAPHISAHNAIRGQNLTDESARNHVLSAQLKRGYNKACRRAKKEHREPPRRDEYYPAGSALPYAPYMAVAMTPAYYPANPGCANFAAGAIGNCCKGACGGGVGAGMCTGGAIGTAGGACAGGGGGCASGGCGSGAGGSCGGGMC